MIGLIIWSILVSIPLNQTFYNNEASLLFCISYCLMLRRRRTMTPITPHYVTSFHQNESESETLAATILSWLHTWSCLFGSNSSWSFTSPWPSSLCQCQSARIKKNVEAAAPAPAIVTVWHQMKMRNKYETKAKLCPNKVDNVWNI